VNRFYGDVWLLEQVVDRIGLRADLMAAFYENAEISIITINDKDYISLTDMVKSIRKSAYQIYVLYVQSL